MKNFSWFYSAIIICLITACQGYDRASLPIDREQNYQSPKLVNVDKNFPIAVGQTIYVPIYSHIYHHDRKQSFNLASTLSIRNTDLHQPLVLTAVKYYDSEGKLLQNYIEQPIEIAGLGSTDFFIESSDLRGGAGAKFIVEWIAPTKITEPIVEAVTIGSASQQGISFISQGKVIANKKPQLQPK